MRFKRRHIKRGRVEIIPMIDTIVILLIFYMTYSRFAEASREANLKLPESRAGEDFQLGPHQMIINMFNADEITIDKRSYRLAEVPALLRAVKRSDPKFENLSVILRANRDMKYQDLSEFMKACAKAGVVDVTFSTTELR